MRDIKFLVFKGKQLSAGSVTCEYKLHDVITVKSFTSSTSADDFLSYVNQEFIDMGANPKTLGEDVIFFNKKVEMKNRTIYDCPTYQHTKTFFIFVNMDYL